MMEELYFNGEISLSSGGASYIQGAKVFVPKDASMNQIVTAIKDLGYISFMLPTMNKLVKL